jgi:DNA-binding MarR family transcriptional regulator
MDRDREKAGRDMKTAESQCTCTAVRQAARQLTQLYDAELAPSGLRVTQYSVLASLDRVGPSSLQDLAADLVMDRSTLGHNLRPLEREGLIKLAVDKSDKRTRRLELTTRGKAKLEESRPLWRKAQDRFEAGYGASSAKELRTVMRRVVDSTQENQGS